MLLDIEPSCPDTHSPRKRRGRPLRGSCSLEDPGPVTVEPTRASLLSRLRDPADAVAWSEFDATYRDLILRHCRRRGLQTEDAEDVQQQVMLALARALPAFRYDAARNRFRDHLGQVVNHAIHRHRLSRLPDPHAFPLRRSLTASRPQPRGTAEGCWLGALAVTDPEEFLKGHARHS